MTAAALLILLGNGARPHLGWLAAVCAAWVARDAMRLYRVTRLDADRCNDRNGEA